MDVSKKSVSFTIDDENGTRELAQIIADYIKGSSICIELVGDVGAGKTTFTQKLTKALGSADIVTSPTFTLENIYKSTSNIIHHFDLYRISDAGLVPEEVNEALHDEKTIVIIEWADVIKGRRALPEDRLVIVIDYQKGSETARKITVSAADDSKIIDAITRWKDEMKE